MIWFPIFKKLISNRATQNDYPEFYQNYIKIFRQPDKSVLIEACDFVVIDTETSGFNTSNDRILSMGAIKVRNNTFKVEDSLQIYLQNAHMGNADAIEIHGITAQSINCVSEHHALNMFLQYVDSSIIVGHNIAFDIAMINSALQRAGCGPVKNKTLDTGNLYARIKNPYNKKDAAREDYSLDYLCESYNILAKDRHTAAGDAFLTCLVFLNIINQLKNRGVKKLKDLL